ncbi:MAG: acyl-CoA dehydrogenase family protein [Micrococcaceae bacterium]
MKADFFDEDLESFRELVAEYAKREVAPYYAQWTEDHNTPREPWLAAGEQGILGLAIPEQYGGIEITDYRYRIVIDQELLKVGAAATALGFHLNDDFVLPFLLDLGTEKQKQKWLPGMVSGEIIASHGFSEPEAGSNLSAIRTTASKDGNHYLVNGQKVFIGNGKNSDIVLALTRTPKGPTLFIVERDMEGFSSGNTYPKMALNASDTTPLVFKDVKVPQENMLGEEGKALEYAAQHYIRGRLAIATAANVISEQALELTKQYVQERKQFGQQVSDFQNTRFVLASMQAKFNAARSLLEDCILKHNELKLTSSEAAQVKLLCTETNSEVVDKCLQLFGGYGFIMEYPIAQLYTASRILPIFGGTNEIMKEIIAKDILDS